MPIKKHIMSLFRSKKRQYSLAGFSLPEVLISSFVLTIGLVVIVNTIARSLNYSIENRNAIIATQLAQEGVELVRNVRDNDFADGNKGFSSSAFSSGEHCRISYSSNLDCQGSQGASSRYTLRYTNGFYGHSSGSGRFSRYIYIDTSGSGDNARVTVRSFVYWGSFIPPSSGDPANCTGINKCIYTETFLTSWDN